MLSSVNVVGAALTCWSEPGSSATAMQDALHWSSQPGGVLRVAAIDGCTPMRQTPTVAGVNGATYAATVTSSALQEHRPVPEVLESVNAHLFNMAPDLVAAARPSATAAVAELTLVSPGLFSVRAWAAGDAQVWVRTTAGWSMLVGGSSCAPEVKERWAPQRDAYKATGIPFHELQDLEAAFYDDPALFSNHTPLGRFEQLLLQHRSSEAFEVVCATDGALLTEAALADLDGWIASVRELEARGVARIKATDDLAVIRVTPTTLCPSVVEL